MSVSDDSEELFQHDVYEQSYTEIRNLKAQLPDGAVILLAREVLARLSEHFHVNDASHDEISPEMVDQLSRALISDDAKLAASLVTDRRKSGTSEQTIYLSYLGAAARRLGEWWNLDEITFAEVTTGTGRIYAILRGLRPVFSSAAAVNANKSAFFASVPGDTHTLGVKMVADLFRNEGWDIELELQLEHDELVERITKSEERVLGLSAGGIHALADLAKLVVAVRIWSPKTLILISGHVVDEAHETVALMGFDAIASDFDEARIKLERLWEKSSLQI